MDFLLLYLVFGLQLLNIWGPYQFMWAVLIYLCTSLDSILILIFNWWKISIIIMLNEWLWTSFFVSLDPLIRHWARRSFSHWTWWLDTIYLLYWHSICLYLFYKLLGWNNIHFAFIWKVFHWSVTTHALGVDWSRLSGRVFHARFNFLLFEGHYFRC